MPTSPWKHRDISSTVLAGHSVLVLVVYTEKWDNSTFCNVFTGNCFQYLSEKAGHPAKNGTVGKYDFTYKFHGYTYV